MKPTTEEIQYTCKGYTIPQDVWLYIKNLENRISRDDKYLEVLCLIATPMRPDCTWNRDRKACQELALKALNS